MENPHVGHTVMTRPRVGLIVPPAGGPVPPECADLYSDAVDFDVADAALRSLDLAGYADAETRLPGLARLLADNGAAAVVLMGTSMSFYRGRAHAEALAQMLADAANRPATTMSAAIVGALRGTSARKVALGTAYIGEVNTQLVGFLHDHGLETGPVRTLDIRDVSAIKSVTSDQIVALGQTAFAAVPDAEVLFISCGGLNTLEATLQLEAEFGRPVISSAVAGAWAAASIAGTDPSRPGWGQFLDRCAPLQPDLIAHPNPA